MTREDVQGLQMTAATKMELNELGDLFDLTLEDEDVDTVGGLVQKELGRIAEVGDVVRVGELRIAVRSIDGRGRNAGEMEVAREVRADHEAEGAA